MKIAVIGLGAIGSTLIDALHAHPRIEVSGILKRNPVTTRAGNVPVFTDLKQILDLKPDLVVECAGHAALRAYGAAILGHKIDLLIASLGALADPVLEEQLRAAATGARMHVPAGALAGLDALAAARHAGLDSVEYQGRKAPMAWRGSPAETMIDLDKVTAPSLFFKGSARTAALTFPNNANVVAGVALAGIGFDRTEVSLFADPTLHYNQHRLIAKGRFGELSTQVIGHPLPENPKTSTLVPYSLMRCLTALTDVIAI